MSKEHGEAPRGSSRNWIFTAYQPEGVTWPLEGEEDPAKFFIEAKMKYIEYQMERCPLTGTIHMQGFMQLKPKVRYKSAKALIPHNPHVEIMVAGTDHNTIYCTKGYSKVRGPWKYGIMVACQGFRSDLAAAAAAVVEGKPFKQIATEYPTTFIKYHRGMQAMRNVLSEPEAQPRNVHVHYYWGETRTGKSWSVWSKYNHDYRQLYSVMGDGKWWQNYTGQKAILFDDFTGQVPFGTMLRWLDKFPLQVEVKGDTVWAHWTEVYFTSNLSIDLLWKKKHVMPPGAACQDWYEDTIEPASRAAFMARVTEIKHFEKRWDDEDTEPDEDLIAMGNDDT